MGAHSSDVRSPDCEKLSVFISVDPMLQVY